MYFAIVNMRASGCRKIFHCSGATEAGSSSRLLEAMQTCTWRHVVNSTPYNRVCNRSLCSKDFAIQAEWSKIGVKQAFLEDRRQCIGRCCHLGGVCIFLRHWSWNGRVSGLTRRHFTHLRPTIADKNGQNGISWLFYAYAFMPFGAVQHQLCSFGKVTYAVEWRQSGTSGAGSSCKSSWHKAVAQMACFGSCFGWLMKTLRVVKVVTQCQSPEKYIWLGAWLSLLSRFGRQQWSRLLLPFWYVTLHASCLGDPW